MDQEVEQIIRKIKSKIMEILRDPDATMGLNIFRIPRLEFMQRKQLTDACEALVASTSSLYEVTITVTNQQVTLSVTRR